MKKNLLLCIIALFVFVGCNNDELHPSEVELIKRIKELQLDRENQTRTLLKMCSSAAIIQFTGSVDPCKLANDILEKEKKEKDYQIILDKSIRSTKKYERR